MALNAELRIRSATETVMNVFQDAYQQYIDYLVRERDSALGEASEAKAEVERAREEMLKLRQECECMRAEVQRWRREAEETKRQLVSTGAKMSLTVVPLGDPALRNDSSTSYCNLNQVLSDVSPKAKRQRQMIDVRAIAIEEIRPN